MIVPTHLLRSYLVGPRQISSIPARSFVTTQAPRNESPQPEGSSKSGVEEQEKDKRLTKSPTKTPRKIPTLEERLAKYEIPDDNPEIPKKHVFQQIRQIRQADPVFTLEEGAKFSPSIFMMRRFKYPRLSEQVGYLEYANRSWDNAYTHVHQFPDLTDVMIVGGGLIGSAVAYYTKKMVNRCADVVVLDKAPYSPNNCTSFSYGLISAQSKNRDISRIATLSKELIRNLKADILVTPEDFAQICYRPVTHLILWPASVVDEVLEAIDRQMGDGVHTEARLPDELEQVWPWLSVRGTDVHLGTHGNQDEALVDPVGLRNVYRTLAQAHGAHFIQAEALDFNMQHNVNIPYMHPLSAGALVARVTSGEIRSGMFAKTLLALGHDMPFLEAQLEMEVETRDAMQDLHFIQPKLRLCFIFNSQAAPIINFPVITDTDGCVLFRDDYAGTFKFYLTLKESAEFFEGDSERFMDLESDEPFATLFHHHEKFEKYFDDVIKPRLVKRIPIMEDARLLAAHSGFESVNTQDSCPVSSLHPYHQKVLVSGGYGNRLMTYGPACAASLSELIILDEERTFDLTNFYWDRSLKGKHLEEFPSLVA